MNHDRARTRLIAAERIERGDRGGWLDTNDGGTESRCTLQRDHGPAFGPRRPRRWDHGRHSPYVRSIGDVARRALSFMLLRSLNDQWNVGARLRR